MLEIVMCSSHTPFSLQLMLIGMQELDVDEWEVNTIYRNCTRSSKQVQWFWQVQMLLT